jgi:hypothetical protein
MPKTNSTLARVLVTGSVLLVQAAVWPQERATSPPINASPTTLRMVCTLEYMVGGDNHAQATTGEELVTVVYQGNGDGVMRRQDVEATFRARVTDEEILGDTEYDVQSTHIHEQIHINRYTAEYRRFYIVGSNSSGLLFVGKCAKVTAPKL